MTTRVSTRVAESAILCMSMGEHDIAVATGTYIIRRVAHIACVSMLNQARATHVAGEDTILSLGRVVVLEVGCTGGQIGSEERSHTDHATTVTAIEPDLVAVVPTAVAHEVANR